ncbi:AAA family ATPase [Pseudoneobacillus sp. C159]
MRFDFLNLRAVGHFTDYEITFDQAKNFHLIYGPNEAGKSTSLRSITHFLYGFPTQTGDSFLHGNSKLRIEGKLRNLNGDILHYTRRKGRTNTVLDENGNAMKEELVTHFLNGISENQFLNMFALDHVRLREGGEALLQSGGNLGESLFSAASGITLLSKVFENLEKKSGEIYKKKASNPALNKLIKEERDLAKKISQYQLKLQNWKDLEETYEQGKKDIERLLSDLKKLRSEQEKLNRMKLTLPKIAMLKDVQNRLIDLADVPNLTDHFQELRKTAQQNLEESIWKKKKAEEEMRDLDRNLKEISLPTGVLEQESSIDRLYRELQSYENVSEQIPKLFGEKNQLEAQVLSFLKEMNYGTDLGTIEYFRLSAEKKDTIRSLLKQLPLLEQALSSLKQEKAENGEQLEKIQAEFDRLTEIPNIHELELMINIVKKAGAMDDKIKLLRQECAQKEQFLIEEINRLPQWEGNFQQLMELHVPVLIETIKKYETEMSQLHAKLQRISELKRSQLEAIENSEARIRELESLSEIPSEDNLKMVRNHRNKGWQLIRSKLSGNHHENNDEYTNGKALETVYEESVGLADTIADKMRIESAKVGEKNKLMADIRNAEIKFQELDLEERSTENELANLDVAWMELWKPTSIKPLSPVEMKEWLGMYQQMRVSAAELKNKQLLLGELEESRQNYYQSLKTALLPFISLSESLNLDELLILAEKYQKQVQESMFKRRNIEEGLAEKRKKDRQMEGKILEAQERLIRWKANWSEVIQGTTFSENTSPEVVENLLAKFEIGIASYDALTFKLKEQTTATNLMAMFEERAKSVLENTNLMLESDNIVYIVKQLYKILQQAKKDSQTINNIQTQLKKLQQNIKEFTHEIDSAEETISNLMKQLDCQTIEELIDTENDYNLKKTYEASVANLEEELLLLGNGLSLQELLAESKEIELDSIEGDLAEIKRKLQDLETSRSHLEQEHGGVKKEYEEVILGANTSSVLALQEKESVLAQLAHLTEQYIGLKLAASLLHRGIEHYRNQNQDPILQRASELFGRLTLGSFSRLMVDYDEKDQPVLMGIRHNGEKVPMEGMSDGTTDQLYLALRIASIEKYTNENEPLPFIVDDILVHFDDLRSKETLKIILELSEKTQVIFFTHHARLVDIMTDIALDHDYQSIELVTQSSVLV